MIRFYIHKSVVKKIKRESKLLEELSKFLYSYKNMLVENDIEIKYIVDTVYEGKILYRDKIIFDIEDDLESIIVWNIGDYRDIKVKSLLEIEYKHNKLQEVIEGNQFIEKEVEENYGAIERCLKEVIKSKSIEFDYYLDSNQKEIVEKFKDSEESVQAISGAAGSGKTLVLHRLAYEEIIRGRRFLYIVFTKTLKDKFNDFIYDLMETKNNNIETKDKVNVYTYEEFLREYLSPILGIDKNKYITFDECEDLIKKVIKNKFNNLKDSTYLGIHNSELVRMIMSLLVDIKLNDSNEVIDTIVREKLIKLNSRKEISLSEKNIDNIISVVIEYISEVKKVSRKLLWGEYLKDINEALKNNKNYHDYNSVLIDEMQDLSQLEYSLIGDFLENKNIDSSKIVLAYDINQRISLDGSSIRNLINRVNGEITSLKYSYRNSYNIQKFAKNFIESKKDNEEDLKTNINSNKVKILIERDINYVIEKIKNSFMPESDLNIGILAFGDSYYKYYDDFIDEYGRSKIVGIEYFNEENIKGLEFSNLIILDFMSLLDTREIVSDIDFRKWYVGVTRASENLMVHFSSEEDLKSLNSILYEKFENNIIEENLKVDNYITLTRDSEIAFEEFTKDLLVSLGGESKAILLNEGKSLLEAYEKTLDKDILDDAINIFYKLKSFNTLMSLLRAIKEPNNNLNMEIVKVAIILYDKEILYSYFNKVLKNDRNKLVLFALRNNKEVIDFLKDKFNINFDKDKYIKKLQDNISNFKKERNHNSIIKLYDSEELYDEVIDYYSGTKNYNYDIDAKKCIGKAYKRLNRNEEAINFFLQENSIEESIRLCELQGNYMKAYNISMDEFKKIYSKKDNEAIKKIGQKIVDLSLKIKKEQVYLNALEVSKKINNYKEHNIYFELYLLTLNIKYNIETIKIYYGKDDFKAVLRCFEKSSDQIEKNKENEVLYMVAKSYENLNLNTNATKLYIGIEDYFKAVSLLFNDKKYNEIIDIYENKSDDIYDNKYGNMIVEAYDNTNNVNTAIAICFKINNIDKAIEIYYNKNLFEDAITLYKENIDFNYENRTYKLLENCTSDLKDFELNAFICHYKTREFGKAIESYYELQNKNEIIKIYEEECNLPIEKEAIRKLMFNDDITNERLEAVINNIIEAYESFNEIEKALNLYLAINNKSVVDRVIEIYYQLERYKELIDYKNKVNIDYEVDSYEYIANAYERLDEFKNAIDTYIKLLKKSKDKKYIFEVLRLSEYLEYDGANKLNRELKLIKDLSNEENEFIEEELIKYISREFDKVKDELSLNDLIQNGKRKNYFKLYLDILENYCKNKGDKVIKEIFDYVINDNKNNDKDLINENGAYKLFIEYYHRFDYLFNSRKYKLNSKVNNQIGKRIKEDLKKNEDRYKAINTLIKKNKEFNREAIAWFKDACNNLLLCNDIKLYIDNNAKLSRIESLIDRLNSNIKKIYDDEVNIRKILEGLDRLFKNYNNFKFSTANNTLYLNEFDKYNKVIREFKNTNAIISYIEEKYIWISDVFLRIEEENKITSKIKEEIKEVYQFKDMPIELDIENNSIVNKIGKDKKEDLKGTSNIKEGKVVDLPENTHIDEVIKGEDEVLEDIKVTEDEKASVDKQEKNKQTEVEKVIEKEIAIEKETTEVDKGEEKMEDIKGSMDINEIIENTRLEEQIKFVKNCIENSIDDELIGKLTELSKRDLKIIKMLLNS